MENVRLLLQGTRRHLLSGKALFPSLSLFPLPKKRTISIPLGSKLMFCGKTIDSATEAETERREKLSPYSP